LCFCVVLCCVGRGICDGLVTRPEGSYRDSKYDHAEDKGKSLHLKSLRIA
jgi:hypothetical protein